MYKHVQQTQQVSLVSTQYFDACLKGSGPIRLNLTELVLDLFIYFVLFIMAELSFQLYLTVRNDTSTSDHKVSGN